jgi:hypothetical protein
MSMTQQWRPSLESMLLFSILEWVREPTFDTYDEFLELLPTMRRSDTALIGIDDDEWARGMADIHRARKRNERPWPLGLDLLVLR